MLEAGRRSSGAVVVALDHALRVLEPSIDCVLTFVPDGDELVCTHAGGTRAEHFAGLRVRRGGTALVATAAGSGCRASLPGSGEPLIVNDRAAVAMPMFDGDRLLCVVYASSRAGLADGAYDLLVRAIENASVPYAIALEREADRNDATHDGLTGLLSPRAFRRRLHEELSHADASLGRALSLWFVDTDGFKAINDGFGHQAGDGVLQRMALLLRAHLDADLDLAARNGGDEFCALLRGAGKAAAIERAAAFCRAVRRYDFGIARKVTVSVGVATFPYDAGGSSELLERADEAMYRSKRAGRDCVSFVTDAASLDSLHPEAAALGPRSTVQWRSIVDESCVRPSS